MDSNGKNEIQITDNDSSEHHPYWSPDGEKIAFISYDEIYIFDFFSKYIFQLTYRDVHGSINSFSWSK